MARLLCFAALSLLCLSLYADGERMVGGYEETSPDTPQVKICAAYATKEINERSNSIAIYGLAEVEKVSRQVVNGVNYKLDLKLRPTVCRKTPLQSNEREGCPMAVGGETEEQHCRVVVYTTLEGVPMKVTKVDCTSMSDE